MVKWEKEDAYARVEATHIPVPVPRHYGHEYQRVSILTVHYLQRVVDISISAWEEGDTFYVPP
jgi:hypothetical protein